MDEEDGRQGARRDQKPLGSTAVPGAACSMARKLRIQYPGALYHVMNRRDRREAIFEDDQDRHRFLSTLGETCPKTGGGVHAFCG